MRYRHLHEFRWVFHYITTGTKCRPLTQVLTDEKIWKKITFNNICILLTWNLIFHFSFKRRIFSVNALILLAFCCLLNSIFNAFRSGEYYVAYCWSFFTGYIWVGFFVIMMTTYIPLIFFHVSSLLPMELRIKSLYNRILTRIQCSECAYKVLMNYFILILIYRTARKTQTSTQDLLTEFDPANIFFWFLLLKIRWLKRA